MALGNIERGHKFADCAQTYTRGIAALSGPQ